MITVDLVFDEGPTVGLGHRRRMEALGVALQRHGAAVRGRAIGLTAPASPADVVVVDSYTVRADEASFGSVPVAAVDDLDRDLAVDLVVHPAPTDEVHVIGRARRVLRGFEYALLAPPEPPSRSGPVRSSPVVLVTMGGSDRTGRGVNAASALAGSLPCAQVRHAPGPWSRRSADPNVATVEVADDLWGELLAADVVVTAAGVTMLESIAVGRPVVAVVTAGNQNAQAAAVARAGAARVLRSPATSGDIVAAVSVLLADPDGAALLGQRGRALIDGRGPDRVAEAVLELV